MLYVSRGRGGWILGSLLLSSTGMMLLNEWVFPEDNGFFFVIVALVIPAMVCLGLGAHARLQPSRMVLERETGRERMEPVVHSLYWIRAEYWGLLYLGLASLLWTLETRR